MPGDSGSFLIPSLAAYRVVCLKRIQVGLWWIALTKLDFEMAEQKHGVLQGALMF
jgi:hypothetical protein